MISFTFTRSNTLFHTFVMLLFQGIFVEGIGCVVSGLWGTGAGTTSYTENISVIAVTGVRTSLILPIASQYRHHSLLIGLINRY